MSDLKQQFDEAVSYVKNAQEEARPSNEEKLKFYSLFKQATEGDVKGKKPGMLDMIGRAKFNAWESLKGKSSEQAMQDYVNLVNDAKRRNS